MKKTTNLKGTVESFNNGNISKEEFFKNLMSAIANMADKKGILDKDDLIQDLCIKVLEKVEAGSSLNASFFAWQIETEVSRYIELSKNSYNETLAAVDEKLACEINIESMAGSIFLDNSMRLLKPRQQIVLQKFSEGYTYAEIGKELGVNGERVRQILNQGLHKMRQYARCNDMF